MDALDTLAAAAAAAAAADEDEGSGLAVQPHNSHAVWGAGGAAGEEDEQAAGAPARNEQGQGPENVAADPQSPACNSYAVSGRGGHVGQKRPAKGLLEPPRSGKVAKGGSLRVKGVWTDTDDLALMVAHVAHGNRWSVISTLLPSSRSDNDVKNRWFSTCRKKKDQDSSLISCYIAMVDASSADLSYKRARAHCFNKAIVAWLRLYEGTERTEPAFCVVLRERVGLAAEAPLPEFESTPPPSPQAEVKEELECVEDAPMPSTEKHDANGSAPLVGQAWQPHTSHPVAGTAAGPGGESAAASKRNEPMQHEAINEQHMSNSAKGVSTSAFANDQRQGEAAGAGASGAVTMAQVHQQQEQSLRRRLIVRKQAPLPRAGHQGMHMQGGAQQGLMMQQGGGHQGMMLQQGELEYDAAGGGMAVLTNSKGQLMAGSNRQRHPGSSQQQQHAWSNASLSEDAAAAATNARRSGGAAHSMERGEGAGGLPAGSRLHAYEFGAHQSQAANARLGNLPQGPAGSIVASHAASGTSCLHAQMQPTGRSVHRQGGHAAPLRSVTLRLVPPKAHSSNNTAQPQAAAAAAANAGNIRGVYRLSSGSGQALPHGRLRAASGGGMSGSAGGVAAAAAAGRGVAGEGQARLSYGSVSGPVAGELSALQLARASCNSGVGHAHGAVYCESPRSAPYPPSAAGSMHDQPARISGRGSASGGPSQYTGQLHAHHHTSQLTAHPTGGFGGCLPLSQLVQHGQGQVLVLQPQGQGQGQGQGQIVSMVNSDGIGLGGGGGARGYGAGGHVMHLIGQSQPQARLSRLSTQTGELVHQKFAVAAEQGSNGGTVAVPSAHVRQVYGVRQAEVLSAQHAQHARHSASAPQQQQQVQQQQQYVSIARQGADGNDMIYIVNGIPMQPMRNVHVVQAPDGVQAIAPLSMQMLNVQGSMRGHGGDEGDDADGYWAMPVQHIQHSWPRPSN